jgi:peroxiredoxin Q/BCP
MFEKNQQAPSFCLKNQNDEHTCLSDFKGNWVVLYFYPKDNTPGCTIEAKNFSESVDKFKNYNTVVIGVSPDSTNSHRKFTKNHNLSLQLLSDPDHTTLKDYNVWKPKKLYGKEFLGVVRSTFLIDPNGNIAYHWPKVKVAGHVNQVMDKLKELQKLD